MRILYAIQATGNGHVARARTILPILNKYAEVDVLLSGIQADIEPGFPVKYRVKGQSFIFGKRGGIDCWLTLKKSNIGRFIREVTSIPVGKYDVVINDFEPVTAWACKLRRKMCIGLSHQSAVLDENAPRPEVPYSLGQFILKYYAPSDMSYGFHFDRYNKRTFTPVIRDEIREQTVEKNGHYTVYLPSFSDDILVNKLAQIENVHWHVFSKHCNQIKYYPNITIKPVNNEAFIKSFVTSNGVLCGAGFETPAEAIFLRKKLMVIPMVNQYEQLCNATALAQLGVPVLHSLKGAKATSVIKSWVAQNETVEISYPDETEVVIQKMLAKVESLQWTNIPYLPNAL